MSSQCHPSCEERLRNYNSVFPGQTADTRPLFFCARPQFPRGVQPNIAGHIVILPVVLLLRDFDSYLRTISCGVSAGSATVRFMKPTCETRSGAVQFTF
jgi:hypothetical protein